MSHVTVEHLDTRFEKIVFFVSMLPSALHGCSSVARSEVVAEQREQRLVGLL